MWNWFGGGWWTWLIWGGIAIILYTILTTQQAA
jgi:hypothetical protein